MQGLFTLVLGASNPHPQGFAPAEIARQSTIGAGELTLGFIPNGREAQIAPSIHTEALIATPEFLLNACKELFVRAEIHLVDKAPQGLRQVDLKIDVAQHREGQGKN